MRARVQASQAWIQLTVQKDQTSYRRSVARAVCRASIAAEYSARVFLFACRVSTHRSFDSVIKPNKKSHVGGHLLGRGPPARINDPGLRRVLVPCSHFSLGQIGWPGTFKVTADTADSGSCSRATLYIGKKDTWRTVPGAKRDVA